MSISPKKTNRGRPEMPADQRAQMQAQISEIAEALFTRDGYAKVSLRRIAKEIGCTPMALYGYYDSKFDILQSLCAAYIEFWLARPDYYRLVFMAEGVTQPDVSLFLDTPHIIAKYSLFQKALSRLCPQAPIAEIKLKLDFLLSALHGITHNKITISGYEWSAVEDQVGLVVRAVG